MSAKEHYDKHLGNIYVWMSGPFEEKQIAQHRFFERHRIFPNSGKVAIDLGAGHGLQSVSLAKLGFSVTSVDFNQQLLNSLQTRCENESINVVQADIIQFLQQTALQAELIVCMGDTLPHLESIQQVQELLKVSFEKLTHGGKLILSFRDLVQAVTGTQRFIPVRSDDHRVLTCFLEFFPEKVMVYDILHERHGDQWTQSVSSYAKLRLDEGRVKQLLLENNFRLVASETIDRMIYIIATKE